MRVDHECGGRANAVAVLTSHDELTDGPSGSLLHGDAFGIRSVAQSGLLCIGEAKGHCHAEKWYQFDTTHPYDQIGARSMSRVT